MELARYQKAILTAAGLALIWLAVYLYSVFQHLNEDYDKSDTMLAQCVLVLDETAQKLKQESQQRILAQGYAERAMKTVSRLVGERSESVMAEMRANDAVEQLKVELARLKDSHAALLAIAQEPKPVEVFRGGAKNPVKRKVKRKRPTVKVQRAYVHQWW